ncbi:hypothetical protein [Microcoleus sp.]|uniref:hypothetical protein n=1 Tax=Microcoleus sp. TaxID=44472 RepID=UPI00352531EE
MQRIFEAILKGNFLEWSNEVPIQGDRPVRVYVTLQEERSTLSAEFRRQRIVEILEKIAASNVFQGFTPVYSIDLQSAVYSNFYYTSFRC